jgi:hypothetical protein
MTDMAYYYAQINQDSICFAILQTYAPINQPHMITISAYDESVLGKRWTGSTWEEVLPPTE